MSVFDEIPQFVLDLPGPCVQAWALVIELHKQNRISSAEVQAITGGIWPTVPARSVSSVELGVPLFKLAGDPIPSSSRQDG